MKIQLLAAFVALAFYATSCSKEKKNTRQMTGTWDITSMEIGEYYTGECGTPAGNFNELTIVDAGSFTFEKGDPNWETSDENANPGSRTFSYTYTPVGAPTQTVSKTEKFDWFFLADNLVVTNPDLFIYESYAMEDFDKKAWTAQTGTSSGCYGAFTYYNLEKQ